ncbi:MAG: diacylglycerol/lipid kinase family protein [Actinomycetota bacterium]
MTIKKGEPWGRPGPVPSDAVVVRSDGDARAVVDEARRAGEAPPPLVLLGGDLCRTLGGRGEIRDGQTHHFPVDIGAALVDGRLHWFVSHLVAMRSWWRGQVVMAMNVQWRGDWNVGHRAHPNDGMLDVYDFGGLSAIDRWQARRRLPSGSHVPHPGIGYQRTAATQLHLRPPLPVFLDGEPIGRARNLSLRVEDDALTVIV